MDDTRRAHAGIDGAAPPGPAVDEHEDERELLIAHLERELAAQAATIESLAHQLHLAAPSAGRAVVRRLWRTYERLRPGDGASSPTRALATPGHHWAPDDGDTTDVARALLRRSRDALRPLTGDVRTIAFYLPQFHPIPENDEWWGKGFTEWVNVARARPNFAGHHQPHLPADLGFYDLRVPEVREQQAELARDHGVHGFCHHYYWFHGRRLLDRPFEEMLSSGRPEFPFCICWANESWTRRWDGGDNEILVSQRSSVEDNRRFIRNLFPAFRDPRYIRVDNRPLLVVYRLDLLKDPKLTSAIWRDEAHAAGFDDLYLCCTETFGTRDPRPHGFDAALEFPPLSMPLQPYQAPLVDKDARFVGPVFDYLSAARWMVSRPVPDYTLLKAVMPGWDNTPRRQFAGAVYRNATPEAYEYWLGRAVENTITHLEGDERMVFVNAWNEWGEGAHLEPDRLHGRRYLEATRNVMRSVSPQPQR